VRLSDYYCKLLIIEVSIERGIATAGGSIYPRAHGAATHGGRNLRSNCALRLRSENWDVLYAAIGSSVPRRGYPQRSILILLSYSACRWLVLSVSSPQ